MMTEAQLEASRLKANKRVQKLVLELLRDKAPGAEVLHMVAILAAGHIYANNDSIDEFMALMRNMIEFELEARKDR